MASKGWLPPGGDQSQLGPVLGIFETFSYDQGHVELKAGDRLALFTDGVTELWNREGVEFGDDGLLGLLRARWRVTLLGSRQGFS